MTRSPLSARLASASGFTIIEMLVSTAVMLIVLAGVFSVLNPAQGTFQAQPEVSDLQQRLRVSVDALNKDLLMAGAGTYSGPAAGALTNFFAPILPFRSGELNPDDSTRFFSDRITLMYVPQTPSQTTISLPMPPTSNEIKVNDQPQCPKGQDLCGFSQGMKLIIFDTSGSWNTFTVTAVQNQAGHLQRHGPDFNRSYAGGSNVTQVTTATYWWNRATNQLMHYDGAQTDTPVVDNVIGLNFEYFGDPQPPTLLHPVTDGTSPWTTYGPTPPRLTEDAGNGYPPGENCVFQVVSNQHVPRLPDLAPGSTGLVPLTEAMLTDGPWCPGNGIPGRFDADLFRIKQVRVTIRVQANLAMLRGTGALFTGTPGTATNANMLVPDQEVRFEVAPRNMNLGR